MKLTFHLPHHPSSDYIEAPVATKDGAIYSLVYRVQQRGTEWWAVLEKMEEVMPADPTNVGVGNLARGLMPTAHEEAAQRRKEWGQINEDANRRVMITGS